MDTMRSVIIMAVLISMATCQLTPAEMNKMAAMMRQLSVYLANKGTQAVQKVQSSQPKTTSVSSPSSSATAKASSRLSSPGELNQAKKAEYIAVLLPFLMKQQNTAMQQQMMAGARGPGGGMFTNPALYNILLMRMMDMDITPLRAMMAGRPGFRRGLGTLHMSRMMN